MYNVINGQWDIICLYLPVEYLAVGGNLLVKG